MKFFLIIMLAILLLSCSDNTEDKTTCRTQEDCPPEYVCGNDNYCKKVEFCDSADWCYENEDFNKNDKPAICENKQCKVNCPESKFFNSKSNKCEELSNECKKVNRIKILSQDTNIRKDQEITLQAKAYNDSDVEIELNNPIWSSSKPNIVSVSSSGVIKGGSEEGSAEIKIESCAKSDSIMVTNSLDVDEGKLKLTIKDSLGGNISGANILINNEKYTSENSEFIIDSSSDKNTISVFKEGYEYITLIDISKKDIIIYLNKNNPKTKSGGYKGDFTYPEGGTLMFGIASTSFPNSILNIDSSFMIGENFKKTIKPIPGMSQEAELPSSMASPMFFKTTDGVESDEYQKYYVEAIEGKRILWGFGASLTMGDVLPFLGIFSETENINFVTLLNQLTPLMKKFQFAFKKDVNIPICDKIVDELDFNNNGNKTELIADFTNDICFPEHNLVLDKKLEGKISVKFPALLDFDGQKTEFIAFMTGIDSRDEGFIPVGMGAASDKKDENDTADGLVDDSEFPYVKDANEINNLPRATIIFTGPTVTKEEDPMSKISGIMNYFPDATLPETLDLSNESFLKIANDSKLDGNEFTSSNVEGANIYRVQLNDEDGNIWHIYSSKPNMTIPNDVSDYFKFDKITSAIQQAIKLKVDYEDLFELNQDNISDLPRLVEKFSRYKFK